MNKTEQHWHDYQRDVLEPMGLSPKVMGTLKNVFFSGTLYAVNRLVAASHAEQPEGAREAFTDLCADLAVWRHELTAAAQHEQTGGRLQ